jgi:aspartate kinase
VLAERSVAGKQLHVFADRTTVAISRENLHDEDRLREALHTRLSGRARLIDGLGAVSVVGAGINATYANVRAGMHTLEGLSIAPAGVATSSFRITWMIPRGRIADAVRALHAKFIESQRPLLPAE